MMKRYFIYQVFLVCVALLLGSGAIQAQDDDEIGIEPSMFDSLTCRQECITETVNVNFPPFEEPPISSLDVFVIMDITGSMGNVLNSVKNGIEEIVNTLRTNAPDVRFGFATFADYPAYGGRTVDVPYTRVSDFTTDLSALSSTINNVTLQSGGDNVESSLRALWESAQLEWRDDAVRVVVIFTDNSPREPDPGRDETLNTADDIVREDAYELLNNNGISVISVSSGGGAANRYLEEVAEETGGEFFTLSNADEIPELLINAIGAELEAERYSLSANPINFSTADADSNWFTASRTSFVPESSGGTVPVTVDICPSQLNLGDGNYNLELDLQKGDELLGSVDFDIEHYDICRDFFVADSAEDDGRECSAEAGDGIFWNSPDIIVRNRQDGGLESEPPIANQENYVYVRLRNIGPLEAAGTLTLYTSETLLISTFPDSWTVLGTQPATIPPNGEQILGPFPWTPTSTQVSLRAVARNAEDEIENENDISCENNIATKHEVYGRISNPTLTDSNLPEQRVGGIVQLPASSTEPFDLRFNLNDVDNNMGVRVEMAGRTENDVYKQDFTVENIATTSGASNIDVTLYDDFDATGGQLPLALAQDGEILTGAVINYTVDGTSYEQLNRDTNTTNADRETANLDRQAYIFAAIVSIVLIAVVLVAVFNQPQNATEE